jgi:hypothetical protein
MTISFLNNRNIAASSSISNLTNPLGVDAASPPGGTTDSQCKPTSFTPVTINDIKAESTDLECVNNSFGTGENFSTRAKSVAFVTSDDSLISVLLVASPDIYERDLAKFEDSVKTVKLSKPGDISLSPTYRTYKEVLNQLIKNQ